MRTKLNGKDLVLLLLYVKGFKDELCEPIEGRTRITKVVFLFEKEVWPKFQFDRLLAEKDMPDFKAFHFGPFSSQVYTDIEFLVNLGFITVQNSTVLEPTEEEALEVQWWRQEVADVEEDPSTYTPESFRLTNVGRSFVEKKLFHVLSSNQLTALELLKKECTGISLRRLLRYVYTNYENMASNSQIRDEILQGYKSESIPYQY